MSGFLGKNALISGFVDENALMSGFVDENVLMNGFVDENALIWLSMKIWFLAIISKSMQDMGVNPRVKMERIQASMQPWEMGCL